MLYYLSFLIDLGWSRVSNGDYESSDENVASTAGYRWVLSYETIRIRISDLTSFGT